MLDFFLDFPNLQFLAAAGDPIDPYCCSSKSELPSDLTLKDYALVNGGEQGKAGRRAAAYCLQEEKEKDDSQTWELAAWLPGCLAAWLPGCQPAAHWPSCHAPAAIEPLQAGSPSSGCGRAFGTAGASSMPRLRRTW